MFKEFNHSAVNALVARHAYLFVLLSILILIVTSKFLQESIMDLVVSDLSLQQQYQMLCGKMLNRSQ